MPIFQVTNSMTNGFLYVILTEMSPNRLSIFHLGRSKSIAGFLDAKSLVLGCQLGHSLPSDLFREPLHPLFQRCQRTICHDTRNHRVAGLRGLSGLGCEKERLAGVESASGGEERSMGKSQNLERIPTILVSKTKQNGKERTS